MKLTSAAFHDEETIPTRFGRDFENINPPLAIEDIPVEAASLVLIMEDPDVPEAAGVPIWDHWIVFNIPADVSEIPEAWSPSGLRGKGTRGELEYGGPVHQIVNIDIIFASTHSIRCSIFMKVARSRIF